MLNNYVIFTKFQKLKFEVWHLSWFYPNIPLRYEQKAIYLAFQTETVIRRYLNSIIWIYTWVLRQVLFRMMLCCKNLQGMSCQKKIDFVNHLFQIPISNRFFYRAPNMRWRNEAFLSCVSSILLRWNETKKCSLRTPVFVHSRNRIWQNALQLASALCHCGTVFVLNNKIRPQSQRKYKQNISAVL